MPAHDRPAATEDVSTPVDPYIRPNEFEVVVSYLHGILPARPLPSILPGPLAALGNVVRPALAKGPTYVMFSGGRDSSAVLSVAAHVAAQDGLDAPVPVTRVYPGQSESDESHWQQMVVKHLGLDEWVRLEIHDENDLLGPGARTSLRRRGLMWPPALHVMDVTYEALDDGGTILTGEGGDQSLGHRRVSPVARALRRPASRQRLVRAGEALLPTGLRAQATSRRLRFHQPWLQPATLQRHRDLIVADSQTEPLRYDRATHWIGRRRAWHVLDHNAGLAATDHGLILLHPLLDPTFLAPLGSFGGRLGFPDRTATMEALFANLLPAELLRRSSKARFNNAYWGEGSRDFARGWDRQGLDPDLVDPVRLHQEWLSDTPQPVTSLMLQAAWLRQDGGAGTDR